MESSAASTAASAPCSVSQSAMVWRLSAEDRPASRSVRYAAEDGTALEVFWSGFAQLGIWSKPGGDFLCIEPWYGTADPIGFGGEFADKPGLMLLRPGERRNLEWRAKPCPGPGR